MQSCQGFKFKSLNLTSRVQMTTLASGLVFLELIRAEGSTTTKWRRHVEQDFVFKVKIYDLGHNARNSKGCR